MLAYVLATAFLLLFVARARRDRRRFSNAVLLGLAVLFLAAGLLGELDRLPDPLWRAATVAIAVSAGLGVVVLAVFLVANGVTMLRREGSRPANLLSLAAGLGIFALIGLLLAAARFDSGALRAVADSVLLVAGYVAFLFLCFLGYSTLYGRVPVRRDVDFVIVLGAGLVDGNQVPPLLASRLDRAHGLYRAQAARREPPVVITSGGKGTDEKVAESQAMADYLIARGLPAEQIVQESESVSTEENLAFCRALMEQERPGYRCLVVTNNFHVFRSSLEARRSGVRGHVLGSPTAAYYLPSATIREFAAVLWSYRTLNISIVLLLVAVGVGAGLH
ncbi:YdcF family protein [Kitasatospora sp. NPDC057223]|uniref:YdcF family protein n=1 Tax=Kitasatospora sp. NPDC057223 TaxID=3346055 RepID=UPI0036354A6B